MKQIIVEIPEDNLVAMIWEVLDLSPDVKLVSWWTEQEWNYQDGVAETRNHRLSIRLEHASLPDVESGGRLPILNLGPAKKAIPLRSMLTNLKKRGIA